MTRTIQDILAGKNTEEVLNAIGEKAGLVCGTRLEDLRGVMTGEITSCSLADTTNHGIAIQERTKQSGDMGFIVLKTQESDTTTVRFHTVVFMKDSVGQYKINIWHAG